MINKESITSENLDCKTEGSVIKGAKCTKSGTF